MKHQRGFTVTELTLVVALLAPLLGLIVTTSSVTMRSLHLDGARAAVSETLERSMQRVLYVTRACRLASYRVQSVAADVVAGRAAVPGVWIDPVDLEARSAIRFESAAGVLAINAMAVTAPRTLRFVRDAGELANGAHDDDDGYVDEGRLMMTYEGTDFVVAANIEGCAFTLDRRLLRIQMQAAIRTSDGRVVRASTIRNLVLRNN